MATEVSRSPSVDTAATQASATPGSAPPVATSAPSKNIYTGLCSALNAWQKSLKDKGQVKIADQYEIVFQPANLIGAATISKPGGTTQKTTPMQQDDSAKSKLEPSTNSVNSKGYTVPVYAGMQIAQFIDEVIKSSSYITDQAAITIDKLTGKMKPNANTSTGQIAWYKINVDTTPLGYDSERKDQAYKITFLITPYALSELSSEYFPQTKFRGVHKSYNYWFTGQNTQVLHFEQDYNYLFKQTFTATIPPVGAASQSDSRDFYSKTWAVASAESSKGAENAANEVGASAADWMYSMRDFANVKLKIIGDPAWLQQGEIATGVTAANFSFKPFLSDGTINFDSSQICFDISWNAPTDYNFDTGVADVTKNNTAKGQPQENQTYMMTECTSTFKGGRFEQELIGKLIVNPLKKSSSAAGTSTTGAGAANTANTPATSNATAPAAGITTDTGDSVRDANTSAAVADQVGRTDAPNPTPANPAATPTTANNVLPSDVPAAPTSNGSIQPTNEQAGPPVALASTQARITNALTLPGQVALGTVLSGTPLQTSTPAGKVNSTTQNMNIET